MHKTDPEIYREDSFRVMHEQLRLACKLIREQETEATSFVERFALERELKRASLLLRQADRYAKHFLGS